MKKIFNLTQHAASQEQIEAGVVDLTPADQKIVRDTLTFESIPDSQDMYLRADRIACLAHERGAHAAMIGGAPFFMGFLEAALRQYKIVPLYAFSRREAVEVNGVKKSIFRHLGWVPAGPDTVTPTPETKRLAKSKPCAICGGLTTWGVCDNEGCRGGAICG